MHGRLILLLAFALWTSVATAQMLKYDWVRTIPSGAVVSSDGSRIAAGTVSTEGIFTIRIFDGRTGYPLDTVVIDYTTTPKEYRAGVTFVDSTLVGLILKDGEEFRLVKYNERQQMFDTLQANLYHTVSYNEPDIYRELYVNRLEGEFPKGVVTLNFGIMRANTYYGSIKNTGATVYIDIHKDSSWLGEVGRLTSRSPSGDRTRMLATYYEYNRSGGGGKFHVTEYNDVNLYEGEKNTLISTTKLPRTDETFGVATVMGRSQTIVSGCKVWLGLIRDSIELSWGRIENLTCDSWVSLSGNSKVVAARRNLDKKRFELVAADIYTKQLEVVDSWSSAFLPRVMMASSSARAVYVATDSNTVRRYAFHPLHQPSYTEWVDLTMKDTVKRFETVDFSGIAATQSKFRLDSIKSTGGTFKFSSNAHSISGTFFATTPGMHDVEMWCTTELDSVTPIYHKGKVYVKDFNGASCSFKTNFLLQNVLVGQGKIIVSPGTSRGTSYVGDLDSLIAQNRFVPDTTSLLSSGVVFYADEQRFVQALYCGDQIGRDPCLDVIEVDMSTHDTTKIARIDYGHMTGWHSNLVPADGFYVQYAELPGTDVRVVGIAPKYYMWGLEGSPYAQEYWDKRGQGLKRGEAQIYVLNSKYQVFEQKSPKVANSIDSYLDAKPLLTTHKNVDGSGVIYRILLETIDPVNGEYVIEHEYDGYAIADAIRCADSIYMTPRGIYRLSPAAELISITTFTSWDGADIVRINNTLSGVIRKNSDTVATIYNHFTGEVLQRLGATHGLPRTGAYSPEHRMFFVGSDSGVVTGYDITRVVSVADETSSTISQVAARYHGGSITIDLGLPIDEVVIYSITGERMFSSTLQDRPLQTSVTGASWSSGAYVVRVRSGQRWGTANVAVVR